MALKLHIDNWITRAEPDFYTMFIKAWIPFNAWYFTEYSTKKDSVALKEIKNTRNKIRNRIEALLTNDDNISKTFRFNLAQLHIELESRRIMNYGNIVSFQNIMLDDYIPNPVTDTDRKGNIYKAIPDKVKGYRAVILDKVGKTLLDKTFNPYDYNSLIIDNQYVSLGNTKIQEKIRICFSRINPLNPINIISTSKTKNQFILLDNDLKIKMINDTEIIAKSIIQVLYTLRCLLFHGELDPNDTNQPIYENAFHLLKTLIKELK
ncbi:MAG: hypothetical protein KDC90_03500 [Ignavibacteriae bacterium]|nr:hypothetical protein [Ignavibacteriota bacterium]